MKPWKLAALTVAQLAAWTGVRYLVVSMFPGEPVLFENHLFNLTFWRYYYSHALFYFAASLFPWWALAAMGWKYAPRILRCAALSFPGLIVVTFLFGKFDEPRQFDAFIPTCVGFIACLIASLTRPDSTNPISSKDSSQSAQVAL